jgi:acyl carrier protein
MDQSDAYVSESDVLVQIQKIAESAIGIHHEIKPGDDLIKDLDLDSLQLLTLATTIESHFNVALSTEESTQIRTVADLCNVVARAARSRC